MGKLSKAIVLVIILILLILFISNSRQHYFKQENHHSYVSEKSKFTDNFAQSFGRGFTNTMPEDLGEIANPNYELSFPKDHYSHDTFDIEWWYVTANLRDDEGNDYALQWTLFRFRNPTAEATNWNNEQVYMAHASVHSATEHWFSEKFSRGNVGNAGVEQSPFKLFIDDWQWLGTGSSLLPAKLNFNAKLISKNSDGSTDSKLNIQLNLSNTGPYVLQGKNGYSIKSGNGKHASHYYSAPFIKVDGNFTVSEELSASNTNKQDKHIAVKGKAWFDQEWTSQLLDQATQGWDWLSLHLDNGDKIMAFRMRLKDQTNYITGSYIYADGKTKMLLPADISLKSIDLSTVGNKELPLSWQLKIESMGVDLTIKSTKNDQWNPALIAYYEGAVDINGTHQGQGFLELTGY